MQNAYQSVFILLNKSIIFVSVKTLLTQIQTIWQK